MRITISLIFCLLTVSLTLEAQQVVTGRVTDRYDDTPIPGATVFIAHTTIGTLTDIDGNFSITVPIQGNFIIVVSHIGFQSASRTIDTPQPSHQINFALQGNILDELVVTPGLPHSRRDENLFWRLFLGERPSNSGMQVLNPEVVRFVLTTFGTLRAFADEPIEIINHNMGYQISYVLHNFEHNFDNNETLLRGMPLFTELTPQNERQRDNWERRRRIAYSISLTHFIRALYQEELSERGFLLAKVHPTEQHRLVSLSLTQTDSIRMGIGGRRVAERAVAFSYSHILRRDAESVQLTIAQPTFLALTSTPIRYDMYSEPYRTFFSRSATFPLIRLMPLSMTIYADGSYSGLLHFLEYRDTVFGLRSRLPMEFGVDESPAQVVRVPLRRRL